MRLTIESTNQVTVYQGAPVRVWHGRTEGGQRCVVLVRAVAVEEGEDYSALAAELKELTVLPERA